MCVWWSCVFHRLVNAIKPWQMSPGLLSMDTGDAEKRNIQLARFFSGAWYFSHCQSLGGWKQQVKDLPYLPIIWSGRGSLAYGATVMSLEGVKPFKRQPLDWTCPLASEKLSTIRRICQTAHWKPMTCCVDADPPEVNLEEPLSLGQCTCDLTQAVRCGSMWSVLRMLCGSFREGLG